MPCIQNNPVLTFKMQTRLYKYMLMERSKYSEMPKSELVWFSDISLLSEYWAKKFRFRTKFYVLKRSDNKAVRFLTENIQNPRENILFLDI